MNIAEFRRKVINSNKIIRLIILLVIIFNFSSIAYAQDNDLKAGVDVFVKSSRFNNITNDDVKKFIDEHVSEGEIYAICFNESSQSYPTIFKSNEVDKLKSKIFNKGVTKSEFESDSDLKAYLKGYDTSWLTDYQGREYLLIYKQTNRFDFMKTSISGVPVAVILIVILIVLVYLVYRNVTNEGPKDEEEKLQRKLELERLELERLELERLELERLELERLELERLALERLAQKLFEEEKKKNDYQSALEKLLESKEHLEIEKNDIANRLKEIENHFQDEEGKEILIQKFQRELNKKNNDFTEINKKLSYYENLIADASNEIDQNKHLAKELEKQVIENEKLKQENKKLKEAADKKEDLKRKEIRERWNDIFPKFIIDEGAIRDVMKCNKEEMNSIEAGLVKLHGKKDLKELSRGAMKLNREKVDHMHVSFPGGTPRVIYFKVLQNQVAKIVEISKHT